MISFAVTTSSYCHTLLEKYKGFIYSLGKLNFTTHHTQPNLWWKSGQCDSRLLSAEFFYIVFFFFYSFCSFYSSVMFALSVGCVRLISEAVKAPPKRGYCNNPSEFLDVCFVKSLQLPEALIRAHSCFHLPSSLRPCHRWLNAALLVHAVSFTNVPL